MNTRESESAQNLVFVGRVKPPTLLPSHQPHSEEDLPGRLGKPGNGNPGRKSIRLETRKIGIFEALDSARYDGAVAFRFVTP